MTATHIANGAVIPVSDIREVASDLYWALYDVEVYMTNCGYFANQKNLAAKVRKALRQARGS